LGSTGVISTDKPSTDLLLRTVALEGHSDITILQSTPGTWKVPGRQATQ